MKKALKGCTYGDVNDKKYVKKQLSFLDENFMDYIDYWNEKYYRNGFCDGMQLIGGSFDN